MHQSQTLDVLFSKVLHALHHAWDRQCLVVEQLQVGAELDQVGLVELDCLDLCENLACFFCLFCLFDNVVGLIDSCLS